MARLEVALTVSTVLLLIAHIVLWIRDVRIASREGLPGDIELWRYPLDQSRKVRFPVMALGVASAFALAAVLRL